MKSALLILLVATSACGTASSSYKRTTANTGELIWAFDGELQVTKNGRVVSDSGWSGLADAVSCVPRAADLASSARSSKITGKTLVLVGGLAGIAGIAGGTYLALSDEDKLGTGLALIGGGTAAFAVTAITGALMLAGSTPKALDAVNIYNDSYQGAVACANPR